MSNRDFILLAKNDDAKYYGLRLRLWNSGKCKKVTVTGGAGFLGSYVVDILQKRKSEVFVPKIENYDLRKIEDIKRMFDNSMPDIFIHLAATIGGIGANRQSPGTSRPLQRF